LKASALTPRGLAGWLARLDDDGPTLRRFAADVDLVVSHGLAPRVAAALLRVFADEEASASSPPVPTPR
jgi:hypothetical protein